MVELSEAMVGSKAARAGAEETAVALLLVGSELLIRRGTFGARESRCKASQCRFHLRRRQPRIPHRSPVARRRHSKSLVGASLSCRKDEGKFSAEMLAAVVRPAQEAEEAAWAAREPGNEAVGVVEGAEVAVRVVEGATVVVMGKDVVADAVVAVLAASTNHRPHK